MRNIAALYFYRPLIENQGYEDFHPYPILISET
jgi:hypothetical protein